MNVFSSRVRVFLALMLLPALASAEGKPLKVGMSIPSLQWEFYLMVRDGVLEQAAKDGIEEVLVVDAQADAARQVSQIQDLLSKGIDVLLYTATGSAASAVPVRLAK